MTKQFRPMLAAKAELVDTRWTKLRFPALASPKLDGVRALVRGGVVLSRSLKPLPNKRLQLQFGRRELEGYDGEMIVGNPWSPTVYNDTVSEVMTIDGPCTADFYVFDRHDMPFHYGVRRSNIHPHTRVHVLEQTLLKSLDDLETYEAAQLDIGYEGVILRDPYSNYKYGRSTVNEGWLLKLKRFTDSEAEIIGMEELMHNANEAQVSELGLTKRQTLQENQVPMGTMGALLVRDIHTGVEFRIGTGFTAEQRAWFWKHQFRSDEKYPVIKYKSFKIGEKDKPRHPVYLGLRDRRDM
jgi:ATP dependent DNA ligase domain.